MVAIQFAVLVVMIAQKEYGLATGTTIRLATAPVDPVDFMRGDYVYLTYDISHLDCRRIAGCNEGYKPGDSVYVELVPESGVWTAQAVSHEVGRRPGATYLRGHVTGHLSWLNVEYGIESYYVAEHHGQEIERRLPRSSESNRIGALQAEVVVPGSHFGQLRQLYWRGQALLP
jgi:uncharacterized membrane-anchored protein